MVKLTTKYCVYWSQSALFQPSGSVFLLGFIYLFIYYANNLSRQTRDMNSNTNSKNKFARKTHKHNSRYGTWKKQTKNDFTGLLVFVDLWYCNNGVNCVTGCAAGRRVAATKYQLESTIAGQACALRGSGVPDDGIRREFDARLQ